MRPYPAYNANLRRSASWTPADIATRAWYRADDRIDVGSVCSQLNDRSGNSRHMTQGTDANRPTPVTRAGQSALQFDGSNDFLSTGDLGSTFSQPATYYLVWELVTTVGVQVMVDGSTAAARNFTYANGSASIRIGATAELIGGALSAGQIYATCGVFNTTSSALYGLSNFVTASASGNVATQGVRGWTIGARYDGAANRSSCYLWELIVVDGAQDAAARALVGNYFMSRYTGLTVTV